MTPAEFNNRVLDALSKGNCPTFPESADLKDLTEEVLDHFEDWVKSINAELLSRTTGKVWLTASNAGFTLEVVGPAGYLLLHEGTKMKRLIFSPDDHKPFMVDPDKDLIAGGDDEG